jgi:hypothetical protein
MSSPTLKLSRWRPKKNSNAGYIEDIPPFDGRHRCLVVLNNEVLFSRVLASYLHVSKELSVCSNREKKHQATFELG